MLRDYLELLRLKCYRWHIVADLCHRHVSSMPSLMHLGQACTVRCLFDFTLQGKRIHVLAKLKYLPVNGVGLISEQLSIMHNKYEHTNNVPTSDNERLRSQGEKVGKAR